MKRLLIALTAYMLCATQLFAQGKSTQLQRMNEIKLQDELYHWDQFTDLNADTAKVNVTRRLLIDINSSRRQEDCLTVADLMPHAKYISIDRGQKKMFFAYIKRQDAAALRPGAAGPVAVAQQDTPAEPAQVMVPKAFVPDAFVSRVMETADFIEVYNLLKALQGNGQVLQFGPLSAVEDYSSLELILFDTQTKKIVTMLSAETAPDRRTNLVDGSQDSLDNYPTEMTAVIWYIKK